MKQATNRCNGPAFVERDVEEDSTLQDYDRIVPSHQSAAMTLTLIKESKSLNSRAAREGVPPLDASSITDDEEEEEMSPSLTGSTCCKRQRTSLDLPSFGSAPPIRSALPMHPKLILVDYRSSLMKKVPSLGKPLPAPPLLPSFYMKANVKPISLKL